MSVCRCFYIIETVMGVGTEPEFSQYKALPEVAIDKEAETMS